MLLQLSLSLVEKHKTSVNNRDRAFHNQGLLALGWARDPRVYLISMSAGQAAGCQSACPRGQETGKSPAKDSTFWERHRPRKRKKSLELWLLNKHLPAETEEGRDCAAG